MPADIRKLNRKRQMEQTIWSKQKRAIVILLIFLGFIAACTIIAKGIYRAGLARVTVEIPSSISITQSIRINGSVAIGPEYGVYVPQGLRVGTVLVQQGDIVEAGQPLFCLEADDLEEQMELTQWEIAHIKAQLADQENSIQEDKQNRNKETARLQEDYDRMVRRWDIQIAQKRQNYENAKKNREEQEELAASDSVSGGDALNIESLKAVENAAAWDVETAILDKEEAILDWQRSLEDTAKELTNAQAEKITLQNQLLLAEKNLAKQKTLAAENGWVTAEEAGVISGCHIQTGERTGDGACLLYSVAGAGGQVEAILSAEQYSYLSVGDTVELTYKLPSGERCEEQGVITYLEAEESQSRMRVNLLSEEAISNENANWSIGQSVQIQYVHKSERYPFVIPSSALHANQTGGYFVYVVEEREGILGMEECIRVIDVTVLEQNNTLAAVEGSGITQDSRVVIGTSRELTENGVVRVME